MTADGLESLFRNETTEPRALDQYEDKGNHLRIPYLGGFVDF